MAYNATLTLTRVWVTNFAIDVGGGVPDNVHAGSMNDSGGYGKVLQIVQAGEFRNYAGGRTRLVVGSPLTYSQGLMLRAVPGADVTKLVQWTGKLLLFRDTYGLKMWGSYLTPSVTWTTLTSPKVADVTFTFTAVTFDEGVA